MFFVGLRFEEPQFVSLYHVIDMKCRVMRVRSGRLCYKCSTVSTQELQYNERTRLGVDKVKPKG